LGKSASPTELMPSPASSSELRDGQTAAPSKSLKVPPET
jgi:hypothetical protein